MPHLGLGIVTVHKRIFHNEWKFLWKTLRTQKINGLAVLFRSFMTNVHKWDRKSHFCVVISDQHKALLGFSRNGNFCCAKFALFYPFFFANCCASFAHEAKQILHNIPHCYATRFAQNYFRNFRKKLKLRKKQPFAQKLNPCVSTEF